jgi:hypothetical protein
MRAGEGFPYNPVNKSRRRHIVRACGGQQLTCDGVGKFLRDVGRPALGQRESVHNLFLKLLNNRAGSALEGYNIDAARAFSFGVLFFAGVTAELNQIDYVPMDNRALQDILNSDPRTFAADCADRIDTRGDGFQTLAHETGAILLGSPYTAIPTRATLMGAGAVDFAVRESLGYTVTAEDLDTAFPFMGERAAAKLNARIVAETSTEGIT